MCADQVDHFDAVIVGSGISGALIAKVLGRANKKVLILEAGEKLPPDINGYMQRFLMAPTRWRTAPTLLSCSIPTAASTTPVR